MGNILSLSGRFAMVMIMYFPQSDLAKTGDKAAILIMASLMGPDGTEAVPPEKKSEQMEGPPLCGPQSMRPRCEFLATRRSRS
jgi:hypothetical protein